MIDAIGNFPGLFITAAGNGNGDTDEEGDDHDIGQTLHAYPCDHDTDNIICVAATDQADELASFSNYGAVSVDVGAPGVNILSTVADSIVLSETFESVTPPAVPSGWVKGGADNNWGTYELDADIFWGNVLYGDAENIPYAVSADTTITSETYNLSTSGATIDFWARCDTEYSLEEWTDFMQLEFSSDGTTFFPAPDPFLGEDFPFRWDEPLLDILNGEDPLSSSGGAVYHFKELPIPTEYLTSDFKFQFRWVANSNTDTGDGCLVDDVFITKYADGSDEQYDYYDGTSMATPHVAGLAALLWGYEPSLASAEVKSTILETGDDVSSHAGKTVSEKRINAFNALNSLIPASHTISGIIRYYDGVKVVPNVTVILEDDAENQLATTTTDENGAYEFAEVANGGDYVIKVDKDDNASGLSSADQIKIGRHIVGLELFDIIYKTIAGDVNNSGGLTSADQVKMGRFIVGLDTDLPSGTWKFYSSDSTLDTTNYLTTGLTRNYTNLTTDSPDQDFSGIKMGDVNNSWSNN